MKNSLELTILVDSNSVIGDEFRSNGVSYFVWIGNEENSFEFIFDTGFDGRELARNADRLRKDLSRIGNIILSHGHFDHTSGLSTILSMQKEQPNLYCNESIFYRKILNRNTPDERDVGITAHNDIDFIRKNAKITYVKGIREIHPGIWTVSDIPRTVETDPVTGHLLNVTREDSNGTPMIDPLDEDTSLLVELNDQELFLIIGCGHSGIRNTIRHVGDNFPGKEIVGIVGGLQLHDKDIPYIGEVYSVLEKLKLKYFCPVHSTGETAAEFFRGKMGAVFVEGGVGTKITL